MRLKQRNLFMRRLICSLLIQLPMSVGLRAQPAGNDLCGSLPASPTQIHGMLLLPAGKTVYFYHLPVFSMAAHKFQVVFRSDLDQAVINRLTADMKSSPGKIYTIEPVDKFSLTQQINKRIAFTAKLVRGHFERKNPPRNPFPFEEELKPPVKVPITEVVLCRAFGGSDQFKGRGRYFVFGNSDKIYAARLLQQSPDFDQVVVLKGPAKLNTVYKAPSETEALKPGDQLVPVQGGTPVSVLNQVFRDSVDVNL